MDDGLWQSPPSTIRRCSSISRFSPPVQSPAKLTLLTPKPLQTAISLPSGGVAPSPLDVELISLKLKASFSSYTSLRDILPSPAVAINSPASAGSASNSGYEISIRNRLVKQAAWAYLQPVSASPGSSGPHFFRWLWLQFSSLDPISSCLCFFNLKLLPCLTRLVDRITRSIGIIFSR